MQLNTVPTGLEYQNIQSQEKTTPYNPLTKPWEVVVVDIFMIGNENILCIVDCYSKFLGLSVSERPDKSNQI